jgi:hypothetical protein
MKNKIILACMVSTLCMVAIVDYRMHKLEDSQRMDVINLDQSIQLLTAQVKKLEPKPVILLPDGTTIPLEDAITNYSITVYRK